MVHNFYPFHFKTYRLFIVHRSTLKLLVYKFTKNEPCIGNLTNFQPIAPFILAFACFLLHEDNEGIF